MMILGSKRKPYKEYGGPLFPEWNPIVVDKVGIKLGGIDMVEKKAAIKIDTTALGEQVERLQKLLPSLSIYNITLEDLELLVKIVKSNNKGK